jgi:hypothetical protein
MIEDIKKISKIFNFARKEEILKKCLLKNEYFKIKYKKTIFV